MALSFYNGAHASQRKANMNARFLPLALIPILLAGCASSAYVSDSPRYENGSYDRGPVRPSSDYRSPSVNVTYTERNYNRGGNFHRESSDSRNEVASTTRNTTTRSTHTTTVAQNGHATKKSTSTDTRSVKSTTIHD